MRIEGDTVALELIGMQRRILGRSTPYALTSPDLDLEAYAGTQNGVSRIHAVLNCDMVGTPYITDLCSRNGTFLNGERLAPLHPYQLRHGDRLRLGRLEMTVGLPFPAAASR